MSDPLVTVIVLLYNDLPHAHRAIQSVLFQSYKDLKIKILDNGSTDNTWGEIQKYANDPRVTLIRNVKNQRSEFAACEALKTDTEYLSFLFADDVYLPQRIEVGLKAFRERPDLDAVFSNVEGVDEHGQNVHGKPWTVFDGDISLMSRHEHLRHFLFGGNCLHPCAMLVKTKTYIEHGGFKPYFHHIGDMIFFTRLLAHGKIEFLRDKLQQITVWSNGRNESSKNIGQSVLLSYERVMFFEEYLSPEIMEQYVEIFEGKSSNGIVLRSRAERLWYLGHQILSADSSYEAKLFAFKCFYKAAEIADADFNRNEVLFAGRTVSQYLAAMGSNGQNVNMEKVPKPKGFKRTVRQAIKNIPFSVPVYRYLKRKLNGQGRQNGTARIFEATKTGISLLPNTKQDGSHSTQNSPRLPATGDCDGLPRPSSNGRHVELIRQGNREYFKNKTILIHLEFTEVCNQHCSYCLEGNGDLNKPRPNFSKEEDMLGTIDKIFKAYDKDVRLGFVHVGGEPTLQPSFRKVADKIKTRETAFQILTTNFTQSVEYYRSLDIPLITSLHFDSQDPEAWLVKTLQLNDLVAHTRIMAHPQKMDLVRKAYELFCQAAKEHPLSFAVEIINPFGDYMPNYAEEDLEYIKNAKPVDCVYPQSLQKKLGILNDLFYRYNWTYLDKNRTIIKKSEGTDNFKNFYCERDMLIIHKDGKMETGWYCEKSDVNIYDAQDLPDGLIRTVVCDREKCPMSFAAQFPKYKSLEYAPNYVDKLDLMSLER
jgi:glycosyltransferase involved in cell wall biosynthesis/organic radical activating enzyme